MLPADSLGTWRNQAEIAERAALTPGSLDVSRHIDQHRACVLIAWLVVERKEARRKFNQRRRALLDTIGQFTQRTALAALPTKDRYVVTFIEHGRSPYAQATSGKHLRTSP